MISYSRMKISKFGEIFLVANPTHLIGIYFSECDHSPVVRSDWKLNPAHPVLKQASAELKEYFQGERKEFSLPLHFEGTAFQQEVWRQISRIPFGKTITYSDLAGRVGAPKATRAAGTATGRNPLGIVIPCHRVVGKHGALGGYAGGLDKKKRLLEIEMSEFFASVA